MSRPKPKVILEHHDTTNYKTEQVLAAASVYSVFFQGAPINLRTMHSYLNYPGPTYKKTSFSNPGHAFNLAERLNKQFNTDEFCVVRLEGGPVVNEEEIRNESQK